MIKKPNYYRKIIQTLGRLYKAHPFYNMGQHISTAMDGSELWGVSDEELLSCLKKYETELEMDIPHEDDIEKIIKDSMHLSSENLLEEE